MSTLSSFLEAIYLPSRLGLADGSAEQLRIAANLYETWAGGPVPLENLSAAAVTQFLSHYAASHAPATVNSKRRALLTLWRAAADQRLAPSISKIPQAAEPHRLPTAWTVAEVERLLTVARQLRGFVGCLPRRHWWPAFLLAIYDTGARVTAVRMARTCDYSPGERYLVLRAEHQKHKRDQWFSLSDQTVAAISPIYAASRALLFPWPYHPRYLWQFFRRCIVRRAGLVSDTRGFDLFHRLRRTHASYQRINGGNPQFAMGHADPHVTQRYIDPRILGAGQVDKLPRPQLSDNAPDWAI